MILSHISRRVKSHDVAAVPYALAFLALLYRSLTWLQRKGEWIFCTAGSKSPRAWRSVEAIVFWGGVEGAATVTMI